ncbi:sphingosine 1-phosphate receptor 4-like protein [Anopheles sinensis]|uniref:Sphingosine 1-phosphate receptor 4-like protein n=1 Tax=Anopheles sinensis TaxID=74873 RepID=A0A084WIR9_ANOSI|nr:sphingosine 1-phosphate receptor 4-like protein [Anopheles sinensis]
MREDEECPGCAVKNGSKESERTAEDRLDEVVNNFGAKKSLSKTRASATPNSPRGEKEGGMAHNTHSRTRYASSERR